MAKVGWMQVVWEGRGTELGVQTEGRKNGFGDRSAVRGGTGVMGKVGTLGEECDSKGGDEDSGQHEDRELVRDNDRWLGNKVWPCSMPACMHMHVCVSAVPGSVLFH